MNNFNHGFGSLCLLVSLLAGCGRSQRDLQPEEIWRRVSPSVVRVEAKSVEGEITVGSGFVCKLNGKNVILSNRHVVLGAKEVKVGSSAGKLFRSPAYRISPDLDLALIDLPKDFEVAPLKTRKTDARIGERVFAIGFPLGLNKSITQGLVSSETEKLVLFDASISSGSSGGPLLDKDGIVLGVVTAGSASTTEELAQNVNFAIKAAFVPKAELFKEPIVRFYDAWRELVKVENNLIDDLQDLRVFDVEKCVQVQMSLPFGLATDTDKAFENMLATNRAGVEKVFNAMYADELDRVIQRHGSLDAGVTNVVTFLRRKVCELDKVPEIFVGLGSDDLLRKFGRDERRSTLFKWDIKPSEIVPLLKVSVEFAKAKYEDEAFKIEFCSEVLKRLKKGDTNIIVIMKKADQAWIGDRTTVRLPYDKLTANGTDEDKVRIFFLCDQKFGHRSGGPMLFGFENETMTQMISEYGGFEGSITSMFSQRALESLERGGLRGAVEYMMNEVEMKKHPDLGVLAFVYACKGDFENAYDVYTKAYMSTFEQVDAFSLGHDYSLNRAHILKDLKDNWSRYSGVYPDSVTKNLQMWPRFISGKSAFALSQPIFVPPETDIVSDIVSGRTLSLEEARQLSRASLASDLNAKLSSREFEQLSEFEKCWVLQAEQESASLGGRYSQFIEIASTNAATSNFYRKYFQFQ